ncbi:dTMP kinase [Thioalkalicoccus limnaeus]|uniref:Thymidylate kinase n=1 Tax=Thioalkalicoccus limnaeus TaxID=120681 RepID=A0ABV4B9I3_9GAMM
MNERGRFITLEGIEGAGKSTQAAVVCDLLTEQGRDLVRTREPGGTEMAERIRTLLLDPAHQGMSAEAELLLLFAARAEHLARTIRPALAAGRWVVCDRFTDATYAYQGGGRGLDSAVIGCLEKLVQGSLRPDLTLLLDLPVAVGLARTRGRAALDRIETENEEFFDRVREHYRQRARLEPARIRLIDAGADLTAVTGSVRRVLSEYLACCD